MSAPTRDKAITFDAARYPIRATIDLDRLFLVLRFSPSVLMAAVVFRLPSRSLMSPVLLTLGDVGEWCGLMGGWMKWMDWAEGREGGID